MKKLQCSTNPDKEHHFKVGVTALPAMLAMVLTAIAMCEQAAHSMIKRVVVDILGERPPGASWRIGDEHKFLHSVRVMHVSSAFFSTLLPLSRGDA